MWNQIVPAFRMMAVLTVLTGLLYPGVVTALSHLLFPSKAHGSLIRRDGKTVGSSLIAQKFAQPNYFHPRPSAAGNDGFDATSSGGSNLGPTSQKLFDRVKAAADRFRKENPEFTGPIPADALTTSGSGLDPHISPAFAEAQIARVAKARGADAGKVRQLVERRTEDRTLGFLGEPRVNVLLLNLDLDQSLAATKN